MELLTLPNPHALAVMLMVLFALVMYASERIRYETTSLLVLTGLALGFHVFPFQRHGQDLQPHEFFLSFGNRGLVAVCALMILGYGIERTGALDGLGRGLAHLWKRSRSMTILLTLVLTLALSSFINDTPVVIMMMPIMIGLAAASNEPASRLLMPMGFVAILGGMMTTIGTSTNILVINVAADMGMEPFGMFDWTPAALAGVSVGMLYLWLVAPRLLPDRQPFTAEQQIRVYTAQIHLPEKSPVIGRTLSEAVGRVGFKLAVRSVRRNPNAVLSPLPDLILQPGDGIVIKDTQEKLRAAASRLRGSLVSNEERNTGDQPLQGGDEQLAEVAITPVSGLVGHPVSDVRLERQHGVTLLAFRRFGDHEEQQVEDLRSRRLQAGDILLVQGTAENLGRLRASADLLVLDGTINLPRKRHAPLALFIMLVVVSVSALKWVPIEISALLGCLAMLLTGCLTWKEAGAALSFKVILIVAASLALGMALARTGGSEYLASLFVYFSFGAPPSIVLLSLMLVMAGLTNIVSNNAAAVIGTPIAIGVAQQLGMPLEPFVLAVVFGANLSFGTPMAYQTHLLIMNVAGYRFSDFVRVGVPLLVIVWLVLGLVLIWAYDL
jgi:di/tricarboxylate transporter